MPLCSFLLLSLYCPHEHLLFFCAYVVVLGHSAEFLSVSERGPSAGSRWVPEEVGRLLSHLGGFSSADLRLRDSSVSCVHAMDDPIEDVLHFRPSVVDLWRLFPVFLGLLSAHLARPFLPAVGLMQCGPERAHPGCSRPLG